MRMGWLWRFVLATVFLVSRALGADVPEELKSTFWEPYACDAWTTGLYHFDEAEKESLDAVLDNRNAPADPLSPAPVTAKGAGRQRAVSAVPLGAPLALAGACQLSPGSGRFGGGLRFAGADGRADGELSQGPRTLEFWMRPEALPADKATVAHVSAGALRKRTIVLRLTRTGELELDWLGQVQLLPGVRCPAGQWSHVALAWDGQERCEVRINGILTAPPLPLKSQGTAPLIQYVLGNDPAGQSGFRGVLDELRTSRAMRQYYPCDLDWPDVEGRMPPRAGQPWFRDAAHLVFHASFNGTLVPAVAPPGMRPPAEVPATIEPPERIDPEKRQFVGGVERQGVVVGALGPTIEYRAKGLLSAERGTIAFWVRPLNWNNSLVWNPFAKFPMKTVPLFEVQTTEKKRAAMVSLVQTPNVDIWQHPVEIHPGRWLHLCWTWDGKEDQWYLDGRPWPYGGAWNAERKPVPSDAWQVLRFGRSQSACALDDFRIYDRVLAPAEVANLAAQFDRRKQVRPLPPIDMTLDYNGVAGRVDVRLFPLSPDYAKVASVMVSVMPAGAAQSIGQKLLSLEGRDEVRGRVETTPMEFTTYDVRAVARDAAGQGLCAAKASFERKAPPWWRNTIGVSDKVMPDWTPVQIKGRTVSVSLREICFGDSGLPEKIVSAGEDILGGPIALAASSGGKAIALEPVRGAFRAEPRGEVRADFRGASAAADLSANVEGYVEFDGMMWFRVTVSPLSERGTGTSPQSVPPGKVCTGSEPVPFSDSRQPALDGLTLRVPYAGDSAGLMHWWSGNHGFRNPRVVHIGATPAGEGTVFRSTDKASVELYPGMRGSFMPYVMLTGDRRGMAWFAENDRGWTPNAEVPAVTIQRQGKTVSLVLNIIGEPVKLTGPRTFEFGLHPIPVKPLEKGWRMTPNWGVFPDSFCGFNLKGSHSTQFYRHPENLDWDMAARRFRGELGSLGGAHREPEFVRGFRSQYGRDPKPRELMVAGLYYDLARIDGFPEHTREWGDLWWSQRYTPEMIDYCVWIWDEWVKSGLAKGIYYDDCFNYPVDAWPSPVTYRLPDGRVQPGFQWRQFREMLKRTRQVCYDRGLTPHLCTHTTHTFFIPYHSFFDTVLDGEDFYQSAGETRDFLDSWPPDRLRFMNPEKWGLITTWLGWHAGGEKNWPKFPTLYWRHCRAYTAGLLAHDILWTCEGLGQSYEIDRNWLRQSLLRTDPETQFVPYWDLGGLAAHAHRDLYVSAWKRSGRCVVSLVNWGNERLEAEVKLDLKAMGLGDVPPEQVQVRDVDATLLKYFDGDVSQVKRTDVPKSGRGPNDALDELLGPADKPSTDQRRAKDPDGALAWKDGVLRCPVRRHDFRLLEFR